MGPIFPAQQSDSSVAMALPPINFGGKRAPDSVVAEPVEGYDPSTWLKQPNIAGHGASDADVGSLKAGWCRRCTIWSAESREISNLAISRGQV